MGDMTSEVNVLKQEFDVPRDAAFKKVRWGCGDQLVFCWSSKSQRSSDVLSWNWHAQQADLPPLLCAWHSTFVELQDKMSKLEEDDRYEVLERAAQTYRASLQDYLLKASHSLAQPNIHQQFSSQDELDQYAAHVDLLKGALSLFHLCEIFFCSTFPYISALFCSWLDSTMPHPPDFEPISALPYNAADLPDPFWPTIYRLCVQGRLNALFDILSRQPLAISSKHDLSAQYLDHLKRLFDHLDQLNQPLAHPTEWFHSLQTMQTEFHGFAASNQNTITPEAIHLTQLVQGSPDLLEQTAESWVELFLANLLFLRPISQRTVLSALAQSCVDAKSTASLNFFEQCVLSTITGDAFQVLRIVDQVVDIRFFSAHLVDMLFHAGLIPNNAMEATNLTTREHYLLHFGHTLAYHPALWQLSCEYYIQCGAVGQAAIRTLIEHREISTEHMALKLLALCDKYQLANLKPQICNAMGMHALRQAKAQRGAGYGNAMRWLLAANNMSLIRKLCSQLVDQLIDKSITLDVLDAVVEILDRTDLCPELTLLTLYRDFCHLLKESSELERSILVALQPHGGVQAPTKAPAAQTQAQGMFGTQSVVVAPTDSIEDLCRRLHEVSASALDVAFRLVSNDLPLRYRLPLLTQCLPLLQPFSFLRASSFTSSTPSLFSSTPLSAALPLPLYLPSFSSFAAPSPSLTSSSSMPPFLVPLFGETLPVMMDVDKTYALMECVETACLSFQTEEVYRFAKRDVVPSIRLALSQNLSRAIVQN